MPTDRKQLAAELAGPAGPDESPGARRPRRGATGVLSATGSLVVHGLLLIVLGAVVWRSASGHASRGPEVKIAFDMPALGDASAPLAGSAAPGAPSRPHEVGLIVEPDRAVNADASLPETVPPMASMATVPAPSVTPKGEGPPALGGMSDAAFGAGPTFSGAAAADRAAAGESGVSFAGLGASNARSVVYVMDASGSMVTSLPFVIAEVERSVSRLAATQKFGVVLFRRLPDGRSGLEVFSPVLVRATASAQERLRDWLSSVEPIGRSVPLSGLERAIAYRPDAVFLLSRAIERSGGDAWDTGGGRGVAGTLARIDALNPEVNGRRPVVIQTIQFLDDDPTGIMQEIGRVHGSRTDASGHVIAGYRVIRRGEDLGEGR